MAQAYSHEVWGPQLAPNLCFTPKTIWAATILRYA